MLVDGFSESVFTSKGKLLFMREDYLRVKISSFAYSASSGEISEDRVEQVNIKIKKDIVAGSMYQKELENIGGGIYTTEDNVGYLINTAIYSYERANPFDIEEVGLYAIDPLTNEEVLVWVGKLKDAILYDPKIDVMVNIYIPITNKDIKVDLYTDPQRIREHNEDINSHKHLRELAENSKLFGHDEGSVNQVVLNNPTWETNHFYPEYREPKMYMFEPSFTNTGASTFKERGKKALPIKYLGNPLAGGALEKGIPTTVVYQAKPTPHFKLIPSKLKSEKKTVWRYQVQEDGATLIPTHMIQVGQDKNRISLSIEGVEVIDLQDFEIVQDGITTKWTTLKKGQWIRVEALQEGQYISEKYETWRFQVEEDGQVDFRTPTIVEDQPMKGISLNIRGFEIVDLTGCHITKDTFTIGYTNLKKGQWVKIGAIKKAVFVDNGLQEVLTAEQADDLYLLKSERYFIEQKAKDYTDTEIGKLDTEISEVASNALLESTKGAKSGVAPLDSSKKVPEANLPTTSKHNVFSAGLSYEYVDITWTKQADDSYRSQNLGKFTRPYSRGLDVQYVLVNTAMNNNSDERIYYRENVRIAYDNSTGQYYLKTYENYIDNIQLTWLRFYRNDITTIA
jgi:hypothetical protein